MFSFSAFDVSIYNFSLPTSVWKGERHTFDLPAVNLNLTIESYFAIMCIISYDYLAEATEHFYMELNENLLN